jgi:hypothetical protein
MTFPTNTLSALHFLGVFAFSALLAASCGPKCEAGFQREDGACVCPEGRFSVDNSCVTLEANQFYWIRDCTCLQDTVRMKFVQTSILGVPVIECQVLSGTSKLSIFSTAGEGEIDTIATGSNLFTTGYCLAQGKECQVKFEGRLVHPDTMRGNLVYRWAEDLDSVIQKCPSQMWRR